MSNSVAQIPTITIKSITIGQGRPKIIVPLMIRTPSALFEALQTLQPYRAQFDLIEWRVDFLSDVNDHEAIIDIAQKIQNTYPEKPLLFTCRTGEEGGEQAITLTDYFALNRAVVASKAVDLIDLEYARDSKAVAEMIAFARSYQVATVLSHHQFQHTPEESILLDRLQAMQAMQGDVIKLAVMPQSAHDVLSLLSATLTMAKQAKQPIVTMSMGHLGKISRVSGELLGSALTFGSVGSTSAPGQMNVEALAFCLDQFHEGG